ncbi:MAG: hypothetical protein JNL19_01140 [Burkholderiales bacterium]|nr:hypothetical protein [Burkholderiales bacterium]
MRHLSAITIALAALGLVACNKAPADAPKPGAASAPAAAAKPAAAAPSTDPEFEQLKTVTAVDACATLTAEKLKAAFPDLSFTQHQALAPRMSGYMWDSRCSYRAGVGTIEFAKDAPTHTVDIYIGTVVNEAKAQANLRSRGELAKAAPNYIAQPDLGPDAYAVTDTGMARVFYVKGKSEYQLNFSDLKTPNAEKVKKIVALAKAL